jgi:hypothetical protein
VGARVWLGQVVLEPTLAIRGASGRTRTDASTQLGSDPANTTDDEDKSSGMDVAASASIRFPLAEKGPLDLVGIAQVAAGWGSQTQNLNVDQTDQTDTRRSSTLSAGLNWGVGIEWFLRRSLSLSLDVTNPVVTYTSTTQETQNVQPIPGTDQQFRADAKSVNSTFSYGLVFQPSLRAMVTLYF